MVRGRAEAAEREVARVGELVRVQPQAADWGRVVREGAEAAEREVAQAGAQGQEQARGAEEAGELGQECLEWGDREAAEV